MRGSGGEGATHSKNQTLPLIIVIMILLVLKIVGEYNSRLKVKNRSFRSSER